MFQFPPIHSFDCIRLDRISPLALPGGNVKWVMNIIHSVVYVSDAKETLMGSSGISCLKKLICLDMTQLQKNEMVLYLYKGFGDVVPSRKWLLCEEAWHNLSWRGVLCMEAAFCHLHHKLFGTLNGSYSFWKSDYSSLACLVHLLKWITWSTKERKVIWSFVFEQVVTMTRLFTWSQHFSYLRESRGHIISS